MWSEVTRILLAEDDVILNESLAEILRLEGHSVYTVCDGQSAWEALLQQPFDCLITDYLMPLLNADQLVRRIAETQGLDHLNVIVLSGLELRQTYASARISATIRKPFDIQNVLRMVG